MRDLATTIAGMASWWAPYRAKHIKARSPGIVAWDSGVLAASELVRRITDDEELALAVHSLLSTKLPEPPRESEGNGS
jgi:hypothetical protein